MSDYVEKLKYVSKDEAVLLMKDEYGQDFIKELGFNPLVNSIDFNLKPSAFFPKSHTGVLVRAIMYYKLFNNTLQQFYDL